MIHWTVAETIWDTGSQSPTMAAAAAEFLLIANEEQRATILNKARFLL